MRFNLKFCCRNFCCSSFSAEDSGYTLQLIDVGALGLRSITWSQGRRSGNFLDPSSEKTDANL